MKSLGLQARPLQTATLDAATSVQALGHAVEVLLAVGSCTAVGSGQAVPRAAKALLATLAKLLAAAHAPGSALREWPRVSRADPQRPWQPVQRAQCMRNVCVERVSSARL